MDKVEINSIKDKTDKSKSNRIVRRVRPVSLESLKPGPQLVKFKHNPTIDFMLSMVTTKTGKFAFKGYQPNKMRPAKNEHFPISEENIVIFLGEIELSANPKFKGRDFGEYND